MLEINHFPPLIVTVTVTLVDLLCSKTSPAFGCIISCVGYERREREGLKELAGVEPDTNGIVATRDY